MKYAIMAELRFDSKAERDKLFSIIKKLKSKLSNSRFHKHLCYHDEIPFKPCEVEEEVVV